MGDIHISFVTTVISNSPDVTEHGRSAASVISHQSSVYETAVNDVDELKQCLTDVRESIETALNKVSSTTQLMNGADVTVRVFAPKGHDI